MIDSYDFGRIVINARKFGSDVVIFPDRINGNWWRKERAYLKCGRCQADR